MEKLAKDLVDELKQLEPVFLAAGNLIADMQETIISGRRHHDKSVTGNTSVDVVSEADFLSQEMILSQLAKTALVDCRLYAEEVSALTEHFRAENGLVLTIDPINRTKSYVHGGNDYSVVVGLHDGVRPLYTFEYYPKLNWWLRLTDRAEQSGPGPKATPVPDNDKIIIQIKFPDLAPVPIETLPDELASQGYVLRAPSEMPFPLSKMLAFARGYFAGILYQNPNVYDGLRAYHYGLVHGAKIFSDRGQEPLDLGDIFHTKTGYYYRGWYLVVRQPGSSRVAPSC